MKNPHNTTIIFEELKSKVKRLTSEEKEQLRDKVLAFLLFGEVKPAVQPIHEPLNGITDMERELIKKLASQTEEMFRLMNRNCDPEE